MLPQTPWAEEEGAPVAPAKPRQPCAIQPPSCPPRSSPEEKPKTNIRVWRVRKTKGLKVPFGKGRGGERELDANTGLPVLPAPAHRLCSCWRAHGPAEPPSPSPNVVYHKELSSLIRDVPVIRLSTHKHPGPPDGSLATTK